MLLVLLVLIPLLPLTLQNSLLLGVVCIPECESVGCMSKKPLQPEVMA
jgi:hypothetical protein